MNDHPMTDSDPAEVMEAERMTEAELEELARLMGKSNGEKFANVVDFIHRRERAARREREAGMRAALEQVRVVTGQVTFPLEERGRKAYRIATDALAHPPEPDRATESGSKANGPDAVSTLANGGEEALKLGLAYSDHIRSLESERDRLVRERDAARDALDKFVQELADPTLWNWTRTLSYRDAADLVLSLAVRLGLTGHQRHPYGGNVWEVNGKQYGRIDKDTPAALAQSGGGGGDRCDCTICGGEGLVGDDGETCACIRAGCRKRHGRDAYMPGGGGGKS